MGMITVLIEIEVEKKVPMTLEECIVLDCIDCAYCSNAICIHEKVLKAISNR